MTTVLCEPPLGGNCKVAIAKPKGGSPLGGKVNNNLLQTAIRRQVQSGHCKILQIVLGPLVHNIACCWTCAAACNVVCCLPHTAACHMVMCCLPHAAAYHIVCAA